MSRVSRKPTDKAAATQPVRAGPDGLSLRQRRRILRALDTAIAKCPVSAAKPARHVLERESVAWGELPSWLSGNDGWDSKLFRADGTPLCPQAAPAQAGLSGRAADVGVELWAWLKDYVHPAMHDLLATNAGQSLILNSLPQARPFPTRGADQTKAAWRRDFLGPAGRLSYLWREWDSVVGEGPLPDAPTFHPSQGNRYLCMSMMAGSFGAELQKPALFRNRLRAALVWVRTEFEKAAAGTRHGARERGSSRRSIRRPTEEQKKIATFYENASMTQAEIAAALQTKLQKPVCQSTVSRAVAAVNRWRKNSPDLNLPQIPTRKRKVARTMDPERLGLGARSDHRPLRQRRKPHD